MPRPPGWLPYLGPPLAGVGAGLSIGLLETGFWGALVAALVAGFAPIVVYRLWQGRHQRRAGGGDQ